MRRLNTQRAERRGERRGEEERRRDDLSNKPSSISNVFHETDTISIEKYCMMGSNQMCQ